MRRILVIGHRGASGRAPENTLKSFELAFKLGADMVELDVQRTSDGALVCIHDDDVSRTTNGTGYVHKLTLKELQELDAGEGQKIPLLSEVLDLARGKFGVNIEVKVHESEREILDFVIERNMLSETMFSSFIHPYLPPFRELEDKAFAGIIFDLEIENVCDYAVELGVNSINPVFSFIDEEMVRSAHLNNLKLIPWTVNDETQVEHLLQMGVDGIISDFPEMTARLVDMHLNE